MALEILLSSRDRIGRKNCNERTPTTRVQKMIAENKRPTMEFMAK